MPSSAWRFDYHPSDLLPPLAWVARIDHPVIRVACGLSVRRADDALFDGTWVGRPGLASVLESTTPFGAGLVVRDGTLFVVPAGHPSEGVFVVRAGGSRPLLISNSLTAVLEAADIELLPGVDYVSRMIRNADGLGETPIELPTNAQPVEFHFFENLQVDPDGALSIVPKPREMPFRSFGEYAARFDAALGSLLANAPGYDPVIALSNGYDSTAVAVVAAHHGAPRALTFTQARPAKTDEADTSDSGEPTATRLGLPLEVVDRLAYMRRDDHPEAEFLATGQSGEDIAYRSMEHRLGRSVFLTGDVGAALWRYNRPRRRDLWRLDISSSSMTEFKLRVDFYFVPLPVFGMTEVPSLQDITMSDEMRPWSVAGYYNRPIARRIAEEAGLPRSSFATVKHAATALIHQDPEGTMTPASVASARAFAEAHGERLDLVARRPMRRRERFVIKASHKLRLDVLGRDLAARQRGLIHHEPRQGSLLFRWGVSQIRSRYAALRDLLDLRSDAG